MLRKQLCGSTVCYRCAAYVTRVAGTKEGAKNRYRKSKLQCNSESTTAAVAAVPTGLVATKHSVIKSLYCCCTTLCVDVSDAEVSSRCAEQPGSAETRVSKLIPVCDHRNPLQAPKGLKHHEERTQKLQRNLQWFLWKTNRHAGTNVCEQAANAKYGWHTKQHERL